MMYQCQASKGVGNPASPGNAIYVPRMDLASAINPASFSSFLLFCLLVEKALDLEKSFDCMSSFDETVGHTSVGSVIILTASRVESSRASFPSIKLPAYIG